MDSFFYLKIKPVIQFDHQGPVFGSPELYCIVIGIDNIEIRHGLKVPLDPAVNIEIILLCIVLKEGGPEKAPGEVDFDTGIDQEQVICTVWIRKCQGILFKVYREISPGLGPEFDTKGILLPGPVVKAPVRNSPFETEEPSLVGLEPDLRFIILIDAGW
jgi:hypothetical protein